MIKIVLQKKLMESKEGLSDQIEHDLRGTGINADEFTIMDWMSAMNFLDDITIILT